MLKIQKQSTKYGSQITHGADCLLYPQQEAFGTALFRSPPPIAQRFTMCPEAHVLPT